MSMERKYRNRFIIQICISFVLLAVLLVQINPARLRNVWGVISASEAIAIAVLLIPSILIRGYRWKLLFENESHKINLFESVQLLFVGLSLNLFLPASSGDIAKSYYGYKRSGVKERMLSISILDKMIALCAVALLGIPFGLYRRDMIYVMLSLLVLLSVSGLAVMSMLCSQRRALQKTLERLNKWTRKKIDFIMVLEQARVPFGKLFCAGAISVPGWLITYFQMYCCFRVVNADVSMTFVLTAAPLLTLARLFPFALSGLGSDEMVLFYIFQTQGLTLEQVLTAAILYRLIVIVLPGVPGLWIFFTKRKFQSVVNPDRTEICRKVL